MGNRLVRAVAARRNSKASAERGDVELVGVVEKVIFHDAESGGVVAALKTGEVVRGTLGIGDDELEPGVAYRFLGQWRVHQRYGDQFGFDNVLLHQSHDRAGVTRYLQKAAKGQNVGIGPATAAKLWDAYGSEAVEVLRLTPDKVAATGLLTVEQATAASRLLAQRADTERTVIDLWSLFDGRGFPRRLIDACIEAWGVKAPELIRKNPFRLLVDHFPGCGFRKTDKLYIDLGFDPEALKRQMLCAWDSLRTDNNGHTWHRRHVAARAIKKLIPQNPRPDDAIALGLRSQWLSAQTDTRSVEWLAESEKAQAEYSLADDIRRVRFATVRPDFHGKPGCAYFFRDLTTGLIKIGFTTNQVETRRQQVASAERLKQGTLIIIGRLESNDPRKLEGELHRRFSGSRHHGEWFKPTPELLRFIDEDVTFTFARSFPVPDADAGADTPRHFAKPCLWPSADSLDPRLSLHQRDVARGLLSHPLAILAGTPGTGKTFLAAAVIGQLARTVPASAIAVCAPTGKAAVRITTAMRTYGIDTIEATTIHRLLRVGRNGHDGAGWGFGYNRKNPLTARFVFVDEVSMLDTSLAASLFEALDTYAHVLLIGDPYQLPPVGHGAPLRDLMRAGVPCGHLTEIKRQHGENNKIVVACAAIKDGRQFQASERFNPETGDNLRFIETDSPGTSVEILKAVLKQFATSGKYDFDPVWDVQVLVARNKESVVSRVELNKVLQGLLNPPGQRNGENAPPSRHRFRVGDKIICLRNNQLQAVDLCDGFDHPDELCDPQSYASLSCGGDAPDDFDEDGFDHTARATRQRQHFIANGEIGCVVATDPQVVIAKFFDPDRLVKIIFAAGKKAKQTEEGEGGGESDNGGGGGEGEAGEGKGSDFDLGYAVTTHKMQGSESRVVIVMVDESAGMVASQEHLYTSISRGSELVILIGKRSVAARQARRKVLDHRKTFLRELLTGEGLKS